MTSFLRAHVYDVIRAQLPNLELDSVFEAKEELAMEVKAQLAETMSVRKVNGTHAMEIPRI